MVSFGIRLESMYQNEIQVCMTIKNLQHIPRQQRRRRVLILLILNVSALSILVQTLYHKTLNTIPSAMALSHWHLPSGSPHLLPVLIPILSCIILSLHVLNLVWLMTVRRFRANMAMSRACMSFFLFGKPAIEFSMTCFQYEIILQ